METTTTTTANTGASLLILLIAFIIIIVMIVALWKIFTKAGKPGWAAIVPIYNTFIMLEIVGRPLWWFILFFVPIANIVVSVILALDLAKVFGKSTLFGIFGLIIFPYVGYLMLAFGSVTYLGPQQNNNLVPPTTTPAI